MLPESLPVEPKVMSDENRHTWKTIKSISRVFHLYAAAYIIGQSFSVFIYGIGYDEQLTGNASFILESVFLGILALSGAMNIWAVMQLSRDTQGRGRWWWMIFGKIVAMIFYTRILEALILSWKGEKDQLKLSSGQEYFARSIKFGLVAIAFLLSVYARFFREDVTKNFTCFE